MKNVEKWVLLIAIVLFTSSCAAVQPQPTATPEPTLPPVPTPLPPCAKAYVSEYANEFSAIFDEWLDAEVLTESTAKIQLSPQIANLQEIKRKASNIIPPTCLDLAQENIVSYMEKMIEAHLSFMGGASDADVAKLINVAGGYLNASTSEITRIGQCAPDCD
ncbi:MAG: hypothetical protein Q7J07_04575 [Pelolinea sp.]|nr:hypothetical protein [Pelolinea sp.]